MRSAVLRPPRPRRDMVPDTPSTMAQLQWYPRLQTTTQTPDTATPDTDHSTRHTIDHGAGRSYNGTPDTDPRHSYFTPDTDHSTMVPQTQLQTMVIKRPARACPTVRLSIRPRLGAGMIRHRVQAPYCNR